jgi:hypothetical protein
MNQSDAVLMIYTCDDYVVGWRWRLSTKPGTHVGLLFGIRACVSMILTRTQNRQRCFHARYAILTDQNPRASIRRNVLYVSTYVLLQACTIVEPKSKRAGKPHAFRIEVQAYAVGSSARVEGTASKTVDGVKFIVRPFTVPVVLASQRRGN